MSMNDLEVASLTLEPIAAMNVVVPPEIRAINIALVDIGAGTSDIAISRDGSVSAYAMATIAGDEITEEIIKTYFVDFATAESMKINSTSSKKDFEYRNIFGITEKTTAKEFVDKIEPAVEHLATAVCEHIQAANKASPAAVFLVGGGSLINGLNKKVAKKLGIPENRVAIGNHNTLRSVDTRGRELGAEFVTPIGIALTAILNRGYDFSVITVNDEKIRVFDTKKLSVYELLTLAGFKPNDIMGRSGRSISFTLNGKRRVVKGGNFTPSSVTVNDESASLNTGVTQGDRVNFTPAVSGGNAEIKLSDILEEFGVFGAVQNKVKEISVFVNDEEKPLDYQINSFDKVEIISENEAEPEFAGEKSPAVTEDFGEPDKNSGEITVILNDRAVTLKPTYDGTPHKFLELLNHTDIDTGNPVMGYTLLLNNKDASFNDVITDGDRATINIMEKAV
jgi:cell division ATPase FtsA